MEEQRRRIMDGGKFACSREEDAENKVRWRQIIGRGFHRKTQLKGNKAVEGASCWMSLDLRAESLLRRTFFQSYTKC